MSSLARPSNKLVRGKSVGGNKGISQHEGLGHISSGKLVRNVVGEKAVRQVHRGVHAKSPDMHTPKMHNPLSKAFSEPGAGIPEVKGSGGKGGRV